MISDATDDGRGARPRGPRRARSRATRAKILLATNELTEKQGFEPTSMVEIAQHAGIGTSTLYHHFPDKRALLFALIEERSERHAEERRSDLELETFLRSNPRAFLSGLLRKIYDRMQNRHWFFVEMTLLAHRDDELRARFEGVKNAGSERLATLIELGQQLGSLRKELDPTTAAVLVSNAFELLTVHVHMLRRPGNETERMLEELTHMLCRYLVEDDPKPSRD